MSDAGTRGLMTHARRTGFALGRVNPIVPGCVFLTGILIAATGRPAIGTGVAVGAVLSLISAALLSRRIDMAAGMGDVGTALMVMQLGFLVTCTVVGIATVILSHFSVATAVADAAGFIVAQLGTLAVFYWTRARTDTFEGRAT